MVKKVDLIIFSRNFLMILIVFLFFRSACMYATLVYCIPFDFKWRRFLARLRRLTALSHYGRFCRKLSENCKTVHIQVNLCHKLLFLHQITNNMTTDCSLNYKFSTWKLQTQNMSRTCCVHKLFWMSKFKIKRTVCVHNMFST